MQKSQKLTDEQKKLIEDNYDFIKGCLITYFKDQAKTNTRQRGLNVVKLYEALSYLPDLAIEYQPESSNGKSFANFAADRCIKRLIDEFRSMNRHLRINKRKRGILDPIKKEILFNKGFCSESDLVLALEERNLDPKDFVGLKEFRQQSASTLVGEQKIDNELNNVDMEDQINSIAAKADEYFSELPGVGMKSRNKLARVRRKLVKEYLIPHAIGDKKKSLAQIGAEVDLSEGRLSQLITDDNMKTFIRKFYKEFDSNLVPVATNASRK